MDPAMIPPSTDLPTGVGGIQPKVAGVSLPVAPGPRFADLLAPVQRSAPGDAAVAVQAERFNQHGFFGAAVGAPAATVAAVLPVSSSEPAAEVAMASPVERLTTPAATPAAVTKAITPMVVRTPPTLATSMAHRPIAFLPVAIPAAMPRSQPSRTTVVAPVQPRPPVRQRPVPTGSFVAVALRVVAQGIEVAAQIAGFDERDRTALADEVAALLSAHGYAPAAITITTAHGPRQEPR